MELNGEKKKMNTMKQSQGNFTSFSLKFYRLVFFEIVPIRLIQFCRN